MQEWVVVVADVLVNYMQVSSVYIYIYLIPLFVFFSTCRRQALRRRKLFVPVPVVHAS